MDFTNTLIPDPTVNYRLYAVRGSSFTQIQVYPAKSTHMKSFGEFDLSMYDAILNTGNPGSFYVLSV